MSKSNNAVFFVFKFLQEGKEREGKYMKRKEKKRKEKKRRKKKTGNERREKR